MSPLTDPAILALDALTTAVAAGDISVLVLGETGSGKQLVAEAVHRRSPRRDRSLLRVNCAALSEAVLDAELFGQDGGQGGVFATGSGATVLLDEIAELPPALQAKLLRVFEARERGRAGARPARAADVRVISTTHRDLPAEVARGDFRKDLYYRLAGALLTVPPLRARPGDIAPLAALFAAEGAADAQRAAPRLSASACSQLEAHDWPGNVRELRNVMERALLFCPGDEIGPEHLSLGTPRSAPAPLSAVLPLSDGHGPPGDERRRIVEALRRCAGNQTRAARLLGISRGTLVSRLAAYDLPRPRLPAPR